MDQANRPLSPHLQVYRPQLTSVLSILHRLTGVGLGAGTLVLAYWLLAASLGADAYATAQDLIGSWIGLLLLFGWSISLFYHLCNGIRHLFWDVGYGYEIDTLYKSGWMVLLGTAVLTALAWGGAMVVGGAS